jgi:hypothetical protein
MSRSGRVAMTGWGCTAMNRPGRVAMSHLDL